MTQLSLIIYLQMPAVPEGVVMCMFLMDCGSLDIQYGNYDISNYSILLILKLSVPCRTCFINNLKQILIKFTFNFSMMDVNSGIGKSLQGFIPTVCTESPALGNNCQTQLNMILIRLFSISNLQLFTCRESILSISLY